MSIDFNRLAAYSVDPFSASPFSVGFDPIVQNQLPAGTTLGHVQVAAQVAAAQPQAEPMSLLKDLVSVAAPVIGGLVGGPAGVAIGTALSGLGSSRVSAPGGTQVASLGALPAIGGAVVGGAVRVGIAGARTIARSAMTYCRRHPAWCAQIGGTAAVAAMIQDGRLPAIRRRRARGISAGEFRGFRKVHKVLSGFCAPRFKIRKGKRC